MSRNLLFLLVAVLLAASACIQAGRTVKVSSTDGLVINEFSSDLSRYERNEKPNLYLEVENVGGTSAKNVKLYILGATWDSNPCPPPNEACPTELASTMSPPDMSVVPAVPGDLISRTWDLDPYSELPEGVEVPITVVARIEYDYSSNGVVTVPVLTKEEYKLRTERNMPIPEAPNVTNSAGPIHIDLDPRGLPIILSSVPTETSLRIYLRNVGSGAPITGNEVGKMTIGLSIDGLGATFTTCGGKTVNEKTVTLSVTLRRGESITIPCNVKLAESPKAGHDYFSIIFNTNYTYFIEKPLTFTVVGTS